MGIEDRDRKGVNETLKWQKERAVENPAKNGYFEETKNVRYVRLFEQFYGCYVIPSPHFHLFLVLSKY